MKIFNAALLIFIFISKNIAAQCKFDKNSQDPFTKSQVIITDHVAINNAAHIPCKVSIGKVDSAYYFYVELSAQDKFSSQIPVQIANDNSYIYLLLSNNESIKLHCVNVFEKDMLGGRLAKYNYILSEEYLKLLETNYITAYRLSTNGGYIEAKTNKKRAKKVMGNAKCLSENSR